MTNPNDSMYPHWDDADHFVPGLTVRQHFAAMAMQGLLSSESVYHAPIEAAIEAVNMADALITELNAEAKP